MTLPDPVKLAIPGFVILIILEMVLVRLGRPGDYEPRDTLTSLGMGLGNTLSETIFGGAITAVGFTLYKISIFDIGWTWWAWALCFLGEDFLYYWFHRSAHRVRWFWASHVIHHSSQHYNLSTALRQTWTGPISISFVFRLPLFFIGFPPAMIFFCAGLNLIYQFWIHTELVRRLPAWFEAIMNTPSHHRVHHATNPQYLDANYAGVFIIWDKMFGSFVPEQDEEPCRYGIVKNLGTFNPFIVAFNEWGSIVRDVWHAKNWRERLGFILGPPGWSPDGSRETSEVIKARWRTVNQPAE